jgi:hypothetical protein
MENFIPGTEIVKPSIKLVGTDGNAFAIMGNAVRALRKAKAPQYIIENYQTEATSGDYNHLLATTMQYVEAE